MSQYCKCGKPSKGSIGMLRLCYDCAAAILRQPKRDLRGRFTFMLSHGRRMALGTKEWVPDAALSREKGPVR